MPARTSDASRTLAAAAAGLALMFAAGCASYQLGAPSEPAFKTVFIPPVSNVAFLPQAAPIVTTAVREAFVRDGRLVLAGSPESADRVVEIKLTDYSREMATALPEDTALARKFALTLTADVALVDPRNRDAAHPTFTLSVSVDAYTDSGQQQSEYQAVPLLAGKLATEVVHRVLDTW